MPSTWIEPRKTKQGIRRYVRWRNPDGSKGCAPAGSYKETAIELRNQKQDEQYRGGAGLGDPRKTVEEVISEYFAHVNHTLRPKTLSGYTYSLGIFQETFPNLKANTLTSHHIEQFKGGLLRSHNVNGANIILRSVKTCLNWGVKVGHLRQNPAKSVKFFKPKKVGRFLTRAEVLKLYLASSKKMRKSIYILYNTGLRFGEFLGIENEDIGPDFVDVAGKTGKRRVPLKPGVRRVMIGLCRQWTRFGFSSAWKRAVKGSKLGRVRIHDLRHTFASAYLKSGGTLADLRILGGWKSLAMLQVYADFQEDYLAKRMVKVRL